MHDKFDIGFKKIYRDIYWNENENKSVFFHTLSLLNYIITNEEIVKSHKYKDNIEKIINKELEKICDIPKLHKFYSQKINDIFCEYYIL